MQGYEAYQKLGNIRELSSDETQDVFESLVMFGESNRFAIGLMLLAQIAVGVVRIAQNVRRLVV
jgi:hypothetical protein